MVEFKTTLDANKMTAVNRNTFKKMWFVFVIISVLFIGFGVFAILLPEDASDFYLGIFLVVFGALFTPLVWLITAAEQRRLNKSMPVMSENTLSTFTFDEEKITVVQTKDFDYYDKTVISYRYLHKVLENNDYYFLYISKMQCHVIDKASLTQGTLEELNYYFDVNLGNKFKRS